jgi:hypothetical protein
LTGQPVGPLENMRKKPWCLATNLSDLRMAVQFYGRKMEIEEMFGDIKSMVSTLNKRCYNASNNYLA